jgi:nucleoside-diphosphate-sugar epimerase
MKTILVTGSCGLIGSKLINLLIKNYRVLAVDKSWEEGSDIDGLVRLNFDILDDKLISRLDEFLINYVVHLAAHPGGRSLLEPVIDVDINISGSMRIFDYCSKKNIPIIYASSSIVYGGNHSKPIPENVTLYPGTIYGVCKEACEKYLEILSKEHNLKWTTLRIFATYGEGHTPNTYQGIVNVMLTQLLNSNKLIVKGSLGRVRDMIYVDDVVRAIDLSLFNEKAHGNIINIGTGSPVSISRMIDILIHQLGKNKGDISIIQEKPTIGDVLYNSADTKKAKILLDFEYKYDIEDGIKSLLHSRSLN